MIKRTIEISREPTHLTVRDRQLLLLRKLDPPKALPANPPNLAATIPIEDIGVIVVDEQQTSYSHAALIELVERGAVLVVCGRDHLPAGMLMPLSEHTEVVWRLNDQIAASKPLLKQLWRQIVMAKIQEQARVLPQTQRAEVVRRRLMVIAQEVRSGDAENHEAQAARLYWSEWLGAPQSADADMFQRVSSPGVDAPPPNNFLNYGYAVIRAAVARAIASAGLLPALGIKHRNRSNVFCLADDLMEPLRPLVDVVARELFIAGERTLTQQNKARLLLLLTAPVLTGDGEQTKGPLMVALHRYTASLAAAFAGTRRDLDIPIPMNLPVAKDRRRTFTGEQDEC